MRILIVHNLYKGRGGEDTVVENEISLLSAAGHEIRLHTAKNELPVGFRHKVSQFLRLHYNRQERHRLAREIRAFAPDVVHFHNTFLMLGSSVFTVPRKLNTASCLTVHNYRLFCIAGTAFRDGQICTDCCGRTTASGLRHACYKKSRTQSLALASATQFHNLIGSAKSLDVIACLNSMQYALLQRHGFDASKLVMKPNFSPAVPKPSGIGERTHFLFIGHLTPVKGLIDLMEQYSPIDHLRLDIVGQGPLSDKLEAWAADLEQVTVHGYLQPHELERLWRRARFLVFPSFWLEGMPMVVLEALSRGVPIIANKTSAGGTIASESGGIVYAGRQGLREALRSASTIKEGYGVMAGRALETHGAHFSSDAGLAQLMMLYRTAAKNHGRERP